MRIQPFYTLTLTSFRQFSFFLACTLYGAFGSPTPNHPGILEISVGALLVFAAGGEGGARIYRSLFSPQGSARGSLGAACLLVYGLSVPLLIAFLSGNAPSSILRDLFPFLFLFCPLFFLPLFERKPANAGGVLFCLVFIGLMFSLRSLTAQAGWCGLLCGTELLYLENMPTVLFSGLFLAGAAVVCFMRGGGLLAYSVFFLLLFLSAIPFLAMALTLQRASLGAYAVYLLVLLFLHFYARPARTATLFIPASCIVFLSAIFLPQFYLVFGEVFGKTALVGFNNRPQEAAAVWDAVSQNSLTMLFGLGWGAHFHSPAVGGLSVNFTHNFFTTMLLKTGLCGLIFSLVYIAGVARVLARVVFAVPVLGLALAAPFLIDITLYASFKSLDFGLTLLMIYLSLVYCKQSESFQPNKSFHASSDHTLHEPGVPSCPRRDRAGLA
ncbi:MAG: hypothetical protein KDI90_08600 [Alphaproteobacteria bacterium]|nr:hypothetical protein [Alphaproteobacteria bacterium]